VRAEGSPPAFPAASVADPRSSGSPPQERLLRHLPHSPQLPHREWVQELLLLPRGDDREAVRLPEVRRDLREKLVPGHAGGNGQPRLFQHRRLDLARRRFRTPEEALAPRDVEERLVDGERLDQRGESPVDREDRVGTSLRSGTCGREGRPLRAEPLRGRRRHRRVDAESSRLVRCRRHDAATLVAADDHGIPGVPGGPAPRPRSRTRRDPGAGCSGPREVRSCPGLRVVGAPDERAGQDAIEADPARGFREALELVRGDVFGERNVVP